MHRVKASVYVLAHTVLYEPTNLILSTDGGAPPGLRNMLMAIDAQDWETDGEGMDALAEVAGRLCYMSFVPGMNPNVTKIREGNLPYVANIMAQKHGSVLEHSSITFAFLNCSRVLTHELVRHRAGMAYSQQSMRYVRLKNLPMVMPDEFMADPELAGRCESICGSIEEFLAAITKKYDLDNCRDFKLKKRITSGMRRMVPQGVGTHIIWTANVRALRHLLEMRTSEGAEEEIRDAFNIVGQYASYLAPAMFSDFTVNGSREWVPANSKV